MSSAVSTQDDVRSRLEELGIELDTIRRIPVTDIQPGRFQPRKRFDPVALEELAESIRRSGQVEPAIVNKLDEGRYELVSGERRWRACKIADRKTLRAIVVEITDLKLLAELALLANSDREPLDDQELLAACIRMRDELGMSNEEIARANGKKESWAANLLTLERLHARLLPKLGIVGHGGFSRSVGIELVRLTASGQLAAMKRIREGAVTQKRARSVVDEMLADGAARHADVREPSGNPTEAFASLVMGRVRTALEAVKGLKTSDRMPKIRGLQDPHAGNLRGELENLRREVGLLLEAVGTEMPS